MKKPYPSNIKEYGGALQTTRKGRQGPRPVSVYDSMHFVVRSTHAKGKWSFRTPKNFQRIEKILRSFTLKHGVDIYSQAIHFNHLHIHAKVSSVKGYKRFIRAITAAIAMAVTGMSRWNPLDLKFWDRRPYSRIVRGLAEEVRLQDYIEINKYEANGYSRSEARRLYHRDRKLRSG
jgi:REP element-mobilizing transposase RayT